MSLYPHEEHDTDAFLENSKLVIIPKILRSLKRKKKKKAKKKILWRNNLEHTEILGINELIKKAILQTSDNSHQN